MSIKESVEILNHGQLDAFVSKFDEFPGWPATKQTDYIVYYLTSEGGLQSIGSGHIVTAFENLHLKQYKRLRAYLSEQASSKRGKYVKTSDGYRLARANYNQIEREVKQEPVKVSVSVQLTDLIGKVSDSSEKEFLQEAISCYRVEAYRAFIIMTWIAAITHLQKYIFASQLNEFNVALAKNPDKKIKKIINYDDFSDLKEVKLIEIARAANIISNDVRKVLDEKLGTRNSAGHPSGVKISGHKATEFASDLISNLLLKY